MEYPAVYFDGISSQAKQVKVRKRPDNSIHITGSGGISKLCKPGEYKIHPLVGKTPVKIKLNDGGMIEVPYCAETLEAFVSSSNIIQKTLRVFEKRTSLMLVLAVVAVLTSGVIYIYGLTLIVNLVQPIIPYSLKDKIGSQVMLVLNKSYLSETALGYTKENRLKQLMREIYPSKDLPHGADLLLRSMQIGYGVNKIEVPNAFALLPRTIVVTDALAKNLSDTEVQAVIAHELGHLAHDHGTQNLIRGSASSLLMVALFGADPGIFQTIAVTLFEAQYSQSQESEADKFAVFLLKANNKDPLELSRALTRIDTKEESNLDKYLASHPLTSERAENIKKLAISVR